MAMVVAVVELTTMVLDICNVTSSGRITAILNQSKQHQRLG